MAFGCNFVAGVGNGTTGNVVTFSGVNFGTASADRKLLAIFDARVNQSGASYASVTIGGVTASQVSGTAIQSSDNAMLGSAWYASVPSGTSGSIVVTLSAAVTNDRMGCALYSLTGAASAPSSATAAQSTTDNPSLSLTVPPVGIAVAGFGNRGGIVDSMGWTNATQDYYSTVVGSGGSSDISSAHNSTPGSQTITATTAATGSSSILVGVAWAQAPVVLSASSSPSFQENGGVPITSPQTSTKMTVGASDTLLIVISSICDNPTAGLPTGPPTWGGTAMTPIANISDATGHQRLYAYGLVNPTPGNQTISLPFSVGSLNTGPGWILDAYSFTGTDTTSVANAVPLALVDQSAPSGTVYPATAWSVTTAAGDGVIACNSNTADPNGYLTAVSPGVIKNVGGSVQDYAAMFQSAAPSGTTTSVQFNGGAGGSATNSCGLALRLAQPGLAAPGPSLAAGENIIPRRGRMGGRHYLLMNSPAPITIAPPPTTGGNLPTLGVG